MSLRVSRAETILPSSHYFITFARGKRMRTLCIRPAVLFGGAGLLVLLGGWYLVATLYLVFRDEMVAALMRGEAQTQYAYEDRLADMRTQLDKATSRQLLDQTSLEGTVRSLVSRQAQLEMRAGIVANLSGQLGMTPEAAPQADAAAAIARLAGASASQQLSKNSLGYAPLASQPPWRPASVPGKPHPDDAPSPAERSDARPYLQVERASGLASAAAGGGLAAASLRLALVARSLDRVEATQIRALAGIGRSARAAAARVELALGEAGLTPERFQHRPARNEAQGGPFEPMPGATEAGAFGHQVAGLREALASAERLRKILPFVPFRQPFPGGAEMTSGFGGRVDPFNGRIAMHTGVDFVQAFGAPVRATASGRIHIAGVEGGYGNMVEIDHGFGLSTRYGHLSAILVSPGQRVEAGAVIGEVGSTGRSTGPHLHYETRIDGGAVDPVRFLRVGRTLSASR